MMQQFALSFVLDPTMDFDIYGEWDASLLIKADVAEHIRSTEIMETRLVDHTLNLRLICLHAGSAQDFRTCPQAS